MAPKRPKISAEENEAEDRLKARENTLKKHKQWINFSLSKHGLLISNTIVSDLEASGHLVKTAKETTPGVQEKASKKTQGIQNRAASRKAKGTKVRDVDPEGGTAILEKYVTILDVEHPKLAENYFSRMNVKQRHTNELCKVPINKLPPFSELCELFVGAGWSELDAFIGSACAPGKVHPLNQYFKSHNLPREQWWPLYTQSKFYKEKGQTGLLAIGAPPAPLQLAMGSAQKVQVQGISTSGSSSSKTMALQAVAAPAGSGSSGIVAAMATSGKVETSPAQTDPNAAAAPGAVMLPGIVGEAGGQQEVPTKAGKHKGGSKGGGQMAGGETAEDAWLKGFLAQEQGEEEENENKKENEEEAEEEEGTEGVVTAPEEAAVALL
jgi:hypothetical protein